MPVIKSNLMRGTAILAIAAMIAAGLAGAPEARAETAANAKSALGINLSRVDYYTTEQPFLNVFKTGAASKSNPQGWITHSSSKFDTGEEPYLQLDANGYPTTLQASSADPNSQGFDSVGVLILRGLANSNGGNGPPYRAGQYVVLYDGDGTLSYGFDASLVSHSPGRDVVNVSQPNTGGGFLLLITSTDPKHDGNYVRNIRVVKAEEESLLTQGQMFEPKFLSMLQNFRVLRFMQWSQIDGAGGMVGTWADRTHITDAGWGSANGVPLEVDIQLANTAGADPWLNVPANADADYITQMATLVHNTLNPGLKVYVEFSNEVWNTAYPQFNYAAQQGKATWPSAGVSGYQYNRDWFGMRTAQMCDIWKSVWGTDYSRVVCTLGAQAANPWTATEALNCPLWKGSGNAPCAAHNINAVAIAPYFFDFRAPQAWVPAVPAGASAAASVSLFASGIANLFQELNAGGLVSGDGSGAGDMAMVSAWEAAYKKALAPYNLPFVAYEGGQTLIAVSSPDNGAVAQLYTAANRDARMGAAYTTALDQWKANGGQVYVLYDDVDPPGIWGEWGALESFMDPISPLSASPPKWHAIQDFISANPCWWSGCEGQISADAPMAPSDFKAAN